MSCRIEFHLCYTHFLRNQAIGLQKTPNATCCRILATHFHPADRIQHSPRTDSQELFRKPLACGFKAPEAIGRSCFGVRRTVQRPWRSIRLLQ